MGAQLTSVPKAPLRRMGLASYKSQPEKAMQLGIAACAAAGVTLDVDLRLLALGCRYERERILRRLSPRFSMGSSRPGGARYPFPTRGRDVPSGSR